MRKCWDETVEDYVEMPPEMEAFLDELDAVCRKHGFAIVKTPMDGLQVERYTEDNHFWLQKAHKGY